MLRRIPSIFLNDACSYSEDVVLWHGVAGRYVMLRISLLYYGTLLLQTSSVVFDDVCCMLRCSLICGCDRMYDIMCCINLLLCLWKFWGLVF